ncbi:rab GTPase-activating protein 1-like [Centruroides sculpturatus]|uniref:rab GTPase-activating protein 1-like n=1 Tax=Centruroides sculpturatus TaxID=218467 RepID=UPI000C6D82FB|nr:rab GTPase-activating protein 1-like [Centruroides sculpturatus]
MSLEGGEEKHEKENISEKSNLKLQKKLGKMNISLSDNIEGCECSDKNLSPTLSTSSSSPIEESSSKSISLQFPVDSLLFPKVTYLGCAAINAPRSENEIFRNMAILNEQSSEHAIEITLSIPGDAEGSVILYELNSSTEIATFPIHRILFCARGRPETQEVHCFAFTCSHGTIAETAIFQCHVFKCNEPETVLKVLQGFAKAFRKIPKLPTSRCNSISSDKNIPIGNTVRNNEQVYVFEATLEMKEEDSKGNFATCPRDKEYFKLRCNLEKLIVMTIHQISNNKELTIERCFGLLISPGRNVSQGDMHPLEMVSMNKVAGVDRFSYQISGHWNPTPAVFEVLNRETPRDSVVYVTVAIDVVFAGVQESIRFAIETKAKIFSQNDRFWYFTKKPVQEQFYVRLREAEMENSGGHLLDVVSVDSASQLQRKRAILTLNFGEGRRSSVQSETTPGDQESESDNDEPLLSGTGEVSKDCTEVELEGWGDVLSKWRQNLKQRPKQLAPLVRRGIPEALRGEVWQLLAGCHDTRQMIETYRILITKDSPCENVIQRDINRTFPAHDYFRESGGIGQDSLYKICKAYSVYDQEIGYCQGLSFLAAALLLHMPEEQAFNVLVRIMFDYHLRDMFRNGFEELHLKLFILDRLMEELLPEVYAHFIDLGIEAHMYASQWFLTLFTAKFPLYVVFYIVDIFLLDGADTLFQVAVALLMMSKKDLLALDFEGILKHFRVSLPKKYRTEESARFLLQTAVGIKLKKLKKYKKDYVVFKEQQKQQEDPVDGLKRENKRLLESNMHLEQENDDLAQELITTRMQLKKELEGAEEKIEALTKELHTSKCCLSELEDEKKRLDVEVTQLKGMCRRELQRAETEISRNNLIISEYKQICGQLNSRFEKEQQLSKEMIEKLRAQMKTCENCRTALDAPQSLPMQLPVDETGIPKQGPKCDDSQDQIRELELELAQTKLALVEAECKNQDVNHQLNVALAELQSVKNTWFHKTLSSIRDATKKEYPVKEAKEKDAT